MNYNNLKEINLKISIITVSYNSARTIKNTIESVKSQTYKNIEHVIIDGFSNDETISIISNYNHINKFISERDKGIYDAINKGIKLATGDIIGILNSDDVFYDNHVVQNIINAFLYNPKSLAVFGSVVFYDFNSNQTKRIYSVSNWHLNHFKYGNMPPHPSFYCHKSLFDKYGYYNENYSIAGDFDLILRFLGVHKIPYTKLNFFTNKMSLGGISTKNIISNFILNREIYKSCKENNIYTNYFFIYSKYLWKIFQFKF